MTERANWVVLVRVNERAAWCAHGPMTHREALDYRNSSTGSGMERQLAQLIPVRKVPAPRPIVDVKNGSA